MTTESNHFNLQIHNLDDMECDTEDDLNTARVLELLCSYLRHKAACKIARRNKNTVVADFNMEKCYEIYNQLPMWARTWG